MKLITCEDCAECIKLKGKACCHDMWDEPIENISECPLGIEEEEVQEINKKAESVKIDHGTKNTVKEKKERKPKTVKVSDEKQELFSKIYDNLHEIYGDNASISIQNKLIFVKIGEKTFKIDLIEKRK